jgi:hypothetical protein
LETEEGAEWVGAAARQISGFEYRVSDFRFRVSGFGLRKPRRDRRGLEPPPAKLPSCFEELKSASLITPSSVTRMFPP